MDRTQAENALDLKPGSRGRKSRDGGEETIKLKPIQDACADLMKAYKKAELAKQDYNATAKAVAERSNCNTSDIKRLIKSSATGKYEDTRRHIEQQQALFEGIGEVQGGGATVN